MKRQLNEVTFGLADVKRELQAVKEQLQEKTKENDSLKQENKRAHEELKVSTSLRRILTFGIFPARKTEPAPEQKWRPLDLTRLP
ncbi:MAG: hypothetical protein EPO11_09715 [Gammaproteobacteria bacterium]|nr:MAG: hypothetical protein EPO11_09715 [Gammaproteobacteria bacterium]